MKRLTQAVALTVAAGAAVLGTAGGAMAHDGHSGGASAEAKAVGSPGVLSGNVIQVPVDVPINICGNSIGLIHLLNPTTGNVCVNGSGHDHDHGHDNHH
ncbi:chaplin [Streptomyces sp. NBC_01537]|uniref:chaplin n=1 Tax=Streptomyces sp. NBC_01537 TaxID=2903896 RepID=UPI00386805F7